MAKGFGRRPAMGGMGGGLNMNMIKQAQKMQQDMLKMQEEPIVILAALGPEQLSGRGSEVKEDGAE